MSTSISPIVSGSASSLDPNAHANRIASRMMKELDGNQDGSIDKAEFVKGLSAKGVSASDAAAQFDAIDTQKTGSIGKRDIATAVQNGTLKPPPRPPAGATGAGRPDADGDNDGSGGKAGRAGRPSGGKPAGGGAAAGASAAKTYDPADTNQDGTVSQQEALVYSLKQAQTPSAATTDPSKLGSNVDQTV